LNRSLSMTVAVRLFCKAILMISAVFFWRSNLHEQHNPNRPSGDSPTRSRRAAHAWNHGGSLEGATEHTKLGSGVTGQSSAAQVA
jgi:hypothetical protein